MACSLVTPPRLKTQKLWSLPSTVAVISQTGGEAVRSAEGKLSRPLGVFWSGKKDGPMGIASSRSSPDVASDDSSRIGVELHPERAPPQAAIAEGTAEEEGDVEELTLQWVVEHLSPGHRVWESGGDLLAGIEWHAAATSEDNADNIQLYIGRQLWDEFPNQHQEALKQLARLGYQQGHEDIYGWWFVKTSDSPPSSTAQPSSAPSTSAYSSQIPPAGPSKAPAPSSPLSHTGLQPSSSAQPDITANTQCDSLPCRPIGPSIRLEHALAHTPSSSASPELLRILCNFDGRDNIIRVIMPPSKRVPASLFKVRLGLAEEEGQRLCVVVRELHGSLRDDQDSWALARCTMDVWLTIGGNFAGFDYEIWPQRQVVSYVDIAYPYPEDRMQRTAGKLTAPKAGLGPSGDFTLAPMGDSEMLWEGRRVQSEGRLADVWVSCAHERESPDDPAVTGSVTMALTREGVLDKLKSQKKSSLSWDVPPQILTNLPVSRSSPRGVHLHAQMEQSGHSLAGPLMLGLHLTSRMQSLRAPGWWLKPVSLLQFQPTIITQAVEVRLNGLLSAEQPQQGAA